MTWNVYKLNYLIFVYLPVTPDVIGCSNEVKRRNTNAKSSTDMPNFDFSLPAVLGSFYN